MATRRRRSSTSTRRPAAAARRGRSGPVVTIQRDVARSLVGVLILVVAAIVLIALVAPGAPVLRVLADQLLPAFGVGAWLLPVVLVAGAAAIELRPARGGGWGATVIGGAIAYISALGLLHLVTRGAAHRAEDLRAGGGGLGYSLSRLFADPLGAPAAFVVLLGLFVAGVLLLANMQLGDLFRALARSGRGLASIVGGEPDEGEDEGSAADRAGRGEAAAPPMQAVRRGGRAAPAATPSGTLWDPTHAAAVPAAAAVPPVMPIPIVPAVEEDTGSVERRALPEVRPPAAIAGEGERPEYELPPITVLETDAPGVSGGKMDHARNAEIIVAKLAAFDIPARVTRWNAGPVVTQYEVEPDPSVKVARIEAVSDDLAMALAARTIRIEAPIPGKSVVGLEIPNADFNVVSLRRVIEETRLLESPSKLTFALGRDVAGHARAADLSRMPHLLIAGATGSGKSVMVNSLIVSLLMSATPDDVRIILMDLKRVELAAYNGLPHLLVPVITEPGAARAAFKWTVAEMEQRYRRFAGASVRNLAAWNESRADPLDRLPQIVIMVDELADLMMREGRAVEDPIVRLAQKARAVGIHMVLATQRPSVNVVTGLIKANFPSRIAFAMASQIDSRTILDTPGAEDLIGRGDMLYQPSDLPRPMRLQGVFVSDREIAKVTEHWRAEGEPRYDMAVTQTDEEAEEAAGEAPDEDADRLLSDAIAVVREYDRASASLLQRRLKIGYARAARIIDQLEARGYVGPFDGSNARAVLRRESAPARREPAFDDDEAER
jgi:S-DNA-T family DNA segregation ATPase FtsK/SpoIIIE